MEVREREKRGKAEKRRKGMRRGVVHPSGGGWWWSGARGRMHVGAGARSLVHVFFVSFVFFVLF